MITCPDCMQDLDDVDVGEPCPRCGSLRRDATISGDASLAIEQVFPPTFAASIERVLSQPEVREEIESAGDITLRLTPPSQGSEWLVEARGGEGLLAFAPGPGFEDGSEGASDEADDEPTAPERLPE